jgi:hypothetical protein
MLSFALEKQIVLFLKIKLDGGSIMAMMGSTSKKMYLC